MKGEAEVARRADIVRAVGMAIVALLGAGLYAMVDTMAVPFWVFAAFGAVWSLFLFPFSLWMAARPWRALYGAFWLVLLATWALPWYGPKNFCRDVQRIRPGMTVAEVRERLGPWVEGVPPIRADGPGWFGRQDGRYRSDPWSVSNGEIGILGTVAYRNHPEAAADTADYAHILIANGRVVKAEFEFD